MSILSIALFAFFGTVSILAIGVLATSLRRASQLWSELSTELACEAVGNPVRFRMIGFDNVTPLRPRAMQTAAMPGRYRRQQPSLALREAA